MCNDKSLRIRKNANSMPSAVKTNVTSASSRAPSDADPKASTPLRTSGVVVEYASEPQVPKLTGDGTPDDETCRGYGFSLGTDGYANCRLKLSTAAAENERAQRDYDFRKRQYDEQVAAARQAQQREQELRKQRCYAEAASANMAPASAIASALRASVNNTACDRGAEAPPFVSPPPPPHHITICETHGAQFVCF